MSRTYVVEVTRQGRTSRIEVWASGPADARRIAAAAFPGSVVGTATARKAY